MIFGIIYERFSTSIRGIFGVSQKYDYWDVRVSMHRNVLTYDYSNGKKRTVSGRYLANQLIRSFVILSFENGQLGLLSAFM